MLLHEGIELHKNIMSVLQLVRILWDLSEKGTNLGCCAAPTWECPMRGVDGLLGLLQSHLWDLAEFLVRRWI